VFGGFYAILNLAFPFSPSFPMMGARAQQLRRHRAPRSLRVPGPPNDPSAPLQGCAPRCVDGEQRSRVAAPSRPCTARSLPSCRALHCAILLQKPSRAPQGGAGGVTLPGLPLPPPPPHTHTHTHTHTHAPVLSLPLPCSPLGNNESQGWEGTWVCEADKHKAMDMYKQWKADRS
jgi:hypothetical protein